MKATLPASQLSSYYTLLLLFKFISAPWSPESCLSWTTFLLFAETCCCYSQFSTINVEYFLKKASPDLLLLKQLHALIYFFFFDYSIASSSLQLQSYAFYTFNIFSRAFSLSPFPLRVVHLAIHLHNLRKVLQASYCHIASYIATYRIAIAEFLF